MSSISGVSPEKVFAEFYKHLKPVGRMTVTEWSNRYRMLSPKDSAEAGGRYKSSRVPYHEEIMDCLSAHSPVREVILMKGSQVAGTTSGLNWIGYTIDVDPAPMLMVMPNKDLLKKTSQTRIDPMIEVTPSLTEKVADKDSKDGNTLYEKHFEDGFLTLGSSETANTGRSTPYKKILIDELSKFKQNIGGEGNWYKLLKGRTKTFASSYKIFALSTPGVAGDCPLTHEYEKTDKRLCYVPCPHCGHMQPLEWEFVIWDKKGDGSPDLETVHYQCQKCFEPIYEHHKTKMFANHKWTPTAEPKNPSMRGYHLSSLYAPVGWYSWSEMVKDFTDAKSSKEEMIVFVNTALGKPWSERSEETPKWQALYRRREAYSKDILPFKDMLLIGTADIQKNRIEVGVYAVAKQKESTTCEIWVMDHIVLDGDTASDPNEKYYHDQQGNKLLTPWYKLRKLVQRRYKYDGSGENDLRIPFSCFGIDCGFNSQTVYTFVDSYHPQFMYAVFGDPNKDDKSKRAVGRPSYRDVNRNGVRIDNGMQIWPLGSSTLKKYVYQRLSLTRTKDEVPSSYIHFSKDLDEETFRQLTAEDLIIERIAKSNFVKEFWKKNRRYNEFLDTTAYMLAMLDIKAYNMIKFKDWKKACDKINDNYRMYLDNLS